MKLYKFYNKVIDELSGDNHNSVEDKYPLIGFTNDKEIRDMYVAVRNPESYIEIVTKIDKELYIEYANSHQGQKLDIYEYNAPKYTSSGEVELSPISIVSSWFEKEAVSTIEDEVTSYILDNSVDYRAIFPFIFKSKYVKVLDKLQFIAYWKLLGGVDAYKRVMSDEELEDYDDYMAPEVIFNEFNSLLEEFSSYFLTD